MTINLPVRLLPVTEYWDCHGCGICCRHVIIPLSEEEYERIRGQGWDKHPELAGHRLFVRTRFGTSKYRLAHRPDGFCVFLSPQGRCRIHEKFGADAKPLVCRMFPYQLVPLERFAYLTLRHNCPSVISQQGRSLAEQEEDWRPLVENQRFQMTLTPPPPLTVTYRGNWNQFLYVANAVERFLTDTRFPMVRRLAHAVIFAQLLDRCRLARLNAQQFVDLVGLLERGITKEVAPLFNQRVAPNRTAQLVFRRCLIEYYRLHPGSCLEAGWRGRFTWILTSWSMATGRGRIPALLRPEQCLRVAATMPPAGEVSPSGDSGQTGGNDQLPVGSEMTDLAASGVENDGESAETHDGKKAFADWIDLAVLDNNLGAIHRDVLEPLDDYFEKMAISKRYAVCGRKGWSLTDRVRALATSFSVGLALLSLACPDGTPTRDDVAAVVIALDRGETYRTLASSIFRRRLRILDRMDQLVRLLLWYAR